MQIAIFFRDVVEAELGAIMEGLSLAIQRSDLPIVIESDSSLAVSMVSSGKVDRSIYAALVNEIRLLMRLRQTCVTHIMRVRNKLVIVWLGLLDLRGEL